MSAGFESALPVVAPQPTSLVAVEDQCANVEAWAGSCDSIPALRDATHKLGAIDAYLSAQSREGRARVAAAQRRLEVRIGELLGPAPPNGKGSESGFPARNPSTLTPKERSTFRAMAANRDLVEKVIADSSDKAPASRRRVVAQVRGDERLERVRKLAAEGLSAAEIAAAEGSKVSAIYQYCVDHNIRVTGGKTKAAVEERAAKARRMAQQGHTSRQIADAIGLTFEGFKEMARRVQIDVPADAAVGRTRSHDNDRIVSESIDTLAGVVMGLSLVGDPADAGLDPDQIEGWATSMTDSLRLLNRFSKQLKEMTQ